MSGGISWLPFEIDARNYVEAVVALRARDGYTLDPPPEWVMSMPDWRAWQIETLLGTNAARQRIANLQAREVRTEADDELMQIAKAYSDAQRAHNGQAFEGAQRELDAFTAAHRSEP